MFSQKSSARETTASMWIPSDTATTTNVTPWLPQRGNSSAIYRASAGLEPDGGMYVWMTLPDSIETGFQSPLFRRAVQQEKVMYVPGELCYPTSWPKRPKNQMRLSFGVQSADGVRKGCCGSVELSGAWCPDPDMAIIHIRTGNRPVHSMHCRCGRPC